MDHAKKICYVFGAGDYADMDISARDVGDGFVIAADGGLDFTQKYGILPNLIIGDFDSVSGIPQNGNIITLPKEKDDTDMLAAIKEGLSRGYVEFVLYGGLGGRLDHTLANIQSLSFIASHGSIGYLKSADTVITVISDKNGGRIDFDECHEGYISVFSLGDRCDGVCIRGLKYEIENSTVSCDYPIGVSNEFVGAEAQISLRSGNLAVMWKI